MNIGKLLGTVIGTGEQILSVATGNGGSVSVPVGGDKLVAVSVASPAEAEQLSALHQAASSGDRAAVMQLLYPDLPAKAIHLTLVLADGLTRELRADGDISVADFSRVAMRVASEAM